MGSRTERDFYPFYNWPAIVLAAIASMFFLGIALLTFKEDGLDLYGVGSAVLGLIGGQDAARAARNFKRCGYFREDDAFVVPMLPKRIEVRTIPRHRLRGATVTSSHFLGPAIQSGGEVVTYFGRMAFARNVERVLQLRPMDQSSS